MNGEYQRPVSDVARRCLTLAAIACRGNIETDSSDPDMEVFRTELVSWCNSLGIANDFELEELRILGAPLGSITQTEQTWCLGRGEGLSVLGWSLGVIDKPTQDAPAVQDECARVVGIMQPTSLTVLSTQYQRSWAEVDLFYRQVSLIYWRLIEFELGKRQMDFQSMCDNCWWLKSPILGIELLDRDLRIDDGPIAKASNNRIAEVTWFTESRRRALCWLISDSTPYSEVDTSV